MEQSSDVVILFDGICNTCNAFVDFLLKRDQKNIFKFASLQSPAAQKILSEHSLSTTNFDSVVVISDGHVYQKSQAIFEIFSNLGGAWPLLLIFSSLPTAITDWFYSWFAARRYKFFGQRSQCRVPNASESKKFLS